MHFSAADARLCPDPCAGPCAGCPDRVVCRCLKVTEGTLVEAIVTLGLRTVKEVRAATGAGDGCTCCHREVRDLLEVHAAAVQVESHRLLTVAGLCEAGPGSQTPATEDD